ncbi:MAG: tetratricopeptide repeat protein [Planctomycetes bacterium]|nr:tetratricopeptide repeat protein [Planctomycetota bacterium]
MARDPYSPCPCGSGKKFKWCCQNIFVDIERAFQQDQEGQHETALRIMDEAIRKYPDNPEVWGRKAQLLFQQGRTDEGEEVLQKAFDLNPNYPWGLWMRAQLRAAEGEVLGALILARKAAEAYDPNAHDHLAPVYALIAEAEMNRHRPVAAHAALRILARLAPGDQKLRETMETAFGPKSQLPASARRFYELRRRPEGMAPERKQAWDRALSQVESPRLGSLAAAFDKLTRQSPDDATAWYNLGVVQAWLGENRKALDALDHYLEQEEDDARATEAAVLGEVLRCGEGLEDVADYHEFRVEFQVRDFEALAKLLQEWHDTGRMMVLPSEERSVVAAMLFEPLTATVITTVSAAPQEKKLAGYLVLIGNRLQVWGPRQEAFNRVRDELKTRTALGVVEGAVQTNHIAFTDVVAESLLYPMGPASQGGLQRVLEYAQGYFEETWLRHPLKSLASNPPVDAVRHRTLRKKLLGVIQFLQDCAAGGVIKDYDFDRLRRKLGLQEGPPPARTEAVAADVSAMSAGELSALSVEGLNDEQLEQAYQAAQKLDTLELSGRFARALVARPVSAGQAADRFPLYSFLVQKALSEGDLDQALNSVNEGERVDGEHNEGRRRNDYELRRAQVHVKRREPDLAHDVFTRLIERSPDNLRYRGTAAEGMLSLRQADRALRFAEEGLAVARQKNDRDSEQYLMELVDAAKRQAEGR